jgi:hypothetical protein
MFQFALAGPFATTLRVLGCVLAFLGAHDLRTLKKYSAWKLGGLALLFAIGPLLLFVSPIPLMTILLCLFLGAACCILSAVAFLIFDSLKKRPADNIDLVFSRKNLPVGRQSLWHRCF